MTQHILLAAASLTAADQRLVELEHAAQQQLGRKRQLRASSRLRFAETAQMLMSREHSALRREWRAPVVELALSRSCVWSPQTSSYPERRGVFR
jgi:hypothetical protein